MAYSSTERRAQLARRSSHPQDWTPTYKWMITVFSCLVCFLVGINALAVSSATEYTNAEFGVDDEHFPNSYWMVTAWNGAGVLSPIFGLPAMEEFGVRKFYLTSLGLFAIFQIPPAVAKNYATMIAIRFFAGAFGNIVTNAVANIIEDLWQGESNSWPVALFCWVYLMGFALGPVFGSLVLLSLNWRWIFWISFIVYSFTFVVALFLIKETRQHVIDKRRAKRANANNDKESLSENTDESTSEPGFLHVLYVGVTRPPQLFFTEPVCFVFVLWSALAIGQIFMASQSVTQTFGLDYSWSIAKTSWVQGALATGHTIGLIPVVAQVKVFQLSARKNGGEGVPEKRFVLSIPCSFVFFTGGLFVYGWTSSPTIYWIWPAIGLLMTGIGIMTIVHGAVAYLQDAYADYAGSAIAAVAAVENIMAAFLPLATYSMYNNLGFHWASSLLGFLALAISIATSVLYFYAPMLRDRSPFMKSL